MLCIRKTDGLMGLSLGSGAPGPQQEPEIYRGGVHGAMGHPPELDENWGSPYWNGTGHGWLMIFNDQDSMIKYNKNMIRTYCNLDKPFAKCPGGTKMTSPDIPATFH